jgi:hypothetical protein
VAPEQAVQLALEQWRDSLRRLADATPGTPGNLAAAMAAEDARRAYAGAAAERSEALKELWSGDGDSPTVRRFSPSRAFASEDGMSQAKIDRLLEELRSAGVERQRVLEAAVASDSATYAALEWRAYDEAMTREAGAYEAVRHAMDTDHGVM